jgi:hypothetical protein
MLFTLKISLYRYTYIYIFLWIPDTCISMSHMGNPAVAPRFRRPTTWERVRWHLLFYSNEQAIQPSAGLLHWHPPSYTFSIGPAPRIDVHISVPCLLFIVFSQVIDREAKNPRIAEECSAVLDTLRRLRVRHRQKSIHPICER